MQRTVIDGFVELTKAALDWKEEAIGLRAKCEQLEKENSFLKSLLQPIKHDEKRSTDLLEHKNHVEH